MSNVPSLFQHCCLSLVQPRLLISINCLNLRMSAVCYFHPHCFIIIIIITFMLLPYSHWKSCHVIFCAFLSCTSIISLFSTAVCVFLREMYDARKPPVLTLLSVLSLMYSWWLEELMEGGSSVPQSLARSGAPALSPSCTWTQTSRWGNCLYVWPETDLHALFP